MESCRKGPALFVIIGILFIAYGLIACIWPPIAYNWSPSNLQNTIFPELISANVSESLLLEWTDINEDVVQNSSEPKLTFKLCEQVKRRNPAKYKTVTNRVTGPFVYTLKSDKPYLPKIYHSTRGRMGNILFQYCAWYFLAKSSNHPGVFYSNYDLRKMFNNLNVTIQKKRRRNKVKAMRISTRKGYGGQISDVCSNPKNTMMSGYYESYKLWLNYTANIRQQFVFKQTLQDKARETIINITRLVYGEQPPGIVTYIGIHVRRGDYVKYAPKLLAPANYFANAKKYFRDRFEKPLFVVASNGMKWCRNNIDHNHTYFLIGNSAELDLAILTATNHTIFSAGTFGWWAGWLTNGTTIYYRSKFKKRITVNRFPNHWITV